MQKKYKTIHELKAGDVVYAHGGTFKILYDARPSLSHGTREWKPSGAVYHPEAPDCAYTEGECLTGEVKGYFSKGTKWTFQGNFKACKVTVE